MMTLYIIINNIYLHYYNINNHVALLSLMTGTE